MKQDFYSQHANVNWCILHAGLLPLLTAVLCCGLLATAHAQTNYQRLRSFGFAELSGANPRAPLIEGSDGKLYGTTTAGGSYNLGTVFRLNKDGSGQIVLHSFSNVSGDVKGPAAGLAEGSDGVLYGTTVAGGSGNVGAVFKLNKDGTGYKVVHAYSDASGVDGSQPWAGLISGSDGSLYGTTSSGGT